MRENPAAYLPIRKRPTWSGRAPQWIGSALSFQGSSCVPGESVPWSLLLTWAEMCSPVALGPHLCCFLHRRHPHLLLCIGMPTCIPHSDLNSHPQILVGLAQERSPVNTCWGKDCCGSREGAGRGAQVAEACGRAGRFQVLKITDHGDEFGFSPDGDEGTRGFEQRRK